jgi:hypothetical protein
MSFLEKLLSSGDEVSSKRFAGLLLLVSYIAMTILSLFIELKELTVSLVEWMLYGSLLLLGVNVVEKFKNISINSKNKV